MEGRRAKFVDELVNSLALQKVQAEVAVAEAKKANEESTKEYFQGRLDVINAIAELLSRHLFSDWHEVLMITELLRNQDKIAMKESGEIAARWNAPRALAKTKAFAPEKL